MTLYCQTGHVLHWLYVTSFCVMINMRNNTERKGKICNSYTNIENETCKIAVPSGV